MANSIKKRGQKFLRKFSRVSAKASEESREHIRENFFGRLSHVQNIRLLIFEWILLVMAVIMLAVTQAFWFSASYAEDDFVNGGTFEEATVGRVNSMNPLFAMTGSERVLSRLMFSTLVMNDYTGHPGMGLAQSLSARENGKVWVMRLREGLKWSDGADLTNEDVMFTLGLIQNPAVNSIFKSNLEGVKITESEDGAIVFTLPAAYADFATALEIPVVPKHELADAAVKTLAEDDFSVMPVTSGAFTFNARQVASGDAEEVFYLSANPYYYGGETLLNSFAVHTFATKDDVLEALGSSAVTGTAELSGKEAEEAVAGGYTAAYTPINSGVFAFFNTKTVRSRALRQAIAEGINRAGLRERAPNHVALDYPLVESQIKLEKYPSLAPENYESAVTKIAELSEDGKVHLNVVTVNTGYLPEVSNELKTQLESLGIEAELTVYEETQDFIANIVTKRNYDVLVYEVELGADPDLLPYYHSSQASSSGLNLSGYSNALVDDLLVGARESLDETLRARKYESFLEYWVEDVPAIGLYQANLTYIYNRNVQAYGDKIRLVTPLDRFVDVTSWAVIKATKNLTP